MTQRYQNVMVAIDGSSSDLAVFTLLMQRIQASPIAHVIDTRSFKSVSTFLMLVYEELQVDAESSRRSTKARKRCRCDRYHVVIEPKSKNPSFSRTIPDARRPHLAMGLTPLNASGWPFI